MSDTIKAFQDQLHRIYGPDVAGKGTALLLFAYRAVDQLADEVTRLKEHVCNRATTAWADDVGKRIDAMEADGRMRRKRLEHIEAWLDSAAPAWPLSVDSSPDDDLFAKRKLPDMPLPDDDPFAVGKFFLDPEGWVHKIKVVEHWAHGEWFERGGYLTIRDETGQGWTESLCTPIGDPATCELEVGDEAKRCVAKIVIEWVGEEYGKPAWMYRCMERLGITYSRENICLVCRPPKGSD